MKKDDTIYVKYLFYINVIFTLFFMVLYHFTKRPMLYVVGLFFVGILCIFWGLIIEGKKVKLSKNETLFLGILFISQIIACVETIISFNIECFDIHKILLFCGSIWICFFCAKRHCINMEFFEKILNIIIMLGVIACIYNFIVNRQYFSSMNLSIIMHYTWNFSSFFFTRATYGVFISICAMIALYRFEKKDKLMYLFLYLFFLMNVLITAARMEMIAVVFASIVYMLCSKRFRRIIIPILSFSVFILIIYGISDFEIIIETFVNKYSLYFKGHGGLSSDISTGRFELWMKAWSLTNPLSFIFGHGLGSKDVIMIKEDISILGENLTSFHSGYVDLIFEIGFIGLIFYFSILITVFKRIRKINSQQIRSFFWSIMSIFILVNIADSNMLLFTTDMFSPISNYLFCILPICLSNSKEIGNCEVFDVCSQL